GSISNQAWKPPNDPPKLMSPLSTKSGIPASLGSQSIYQLGCRLLPLFKDLPSTHPAVESVQAFKSWFEELEERVSSRRAEDIALNARCSDVLRQILHLLEKEADGSERHGRSRERWSQVRQVVATFGPEDMGGLPA
ncbi:MAG: hypothetical protein AAF191_16090, partial [Verrucomicrobiota bacterium]